MATPGPQRYASGGRKLGVDPTTLDHALAAMARLRATDARITPVLTLRHFAALTDLPYGFLRGAVARQSYPPYRFVYLKKRIPGRTGLRMISIPPKSLMKAQRWLVEHVLRFTEAHPASYAFHPDSSPVQAAEQHPNTRWLLKVDIEDFFHSVREREVAAIFTRIGFQKLLAFEFARLCTIAVDRGPGGNPAPRTEPIAVYASGFEGMLPQGAPTSPMLANLAMARTDATLAALAAERGFRYSRYADDLAFSSTADRTLVEMRALQREVCRILNEAAFRPNLRKTVIRGPGSRRIVLGLLVDGPTPRLSQAFRDNLRLHLHYLGDPAFGPARHALARKTGMSSLYHHVRGLIGWAQQVEPAYGRRLLEAFEAVDWPPVQPRRIEGSGAAGDPFT